MTFKVCKSDSYNWNCLEAGHMCFWTGSWMLQHLRL